MLNGAVLSLTILGVLSLSDLTLGRMLWAERDGKAVYLSPRRFGQQNSNPAQQKMGSACPGQVCGPLSGRMINALIASTPECDQQDVADDAIDASKQFDSATQKLMVSLAVEYRKAEKNTPPDFSQNPNILRNSVFCQKAPRNPELNCVNQAQDPNNDPNVFFDPLTKKSVKKGDQPNTFTFCENQTKKKTNNNNVSPPPKSTSPADKTKNTSSSPSPTPTGCTSQPDKKTSDTTSDSTNGGKNLQTFSGKLGGVAAPPVTALANGQFQVQGNANFKTLQNALNRSCDVQNNKCADAANASGNKGDLTVAACNTQQGQCKSEATGAT